MAPWDEATSAPTADDGLRAKYRWLAGEAFPAAWGCDGLPDAAALVALLAPPAGA